VYAGEELNGVPHGTGIKHYVNGDYYKGEWVNGLKEGKGEQSYF
jgi:1-phosphatidylinositol-4-phosphate 5-kinase